MSKEEKQVTIETVKDLEAVAPDLVREIEARAVEALDIDKKIADAVTAEKGRIMGIAVEMMGEENGKKFQAIIEQGLTVDQFKAVKGAMGITTEKPEETDESKAQAEALAALQAATPPNPGSGGAITPTDTDFMSLVDAYQAEKKCSRTDALKAIASQNQEAHKKYLEKLKPVGNA